MTDPPKPEAAPPGHPGPGRAPAGHDGPGHPDPGAPPAGAPDAAVPPALPVTFRPSVTRAVLLGGGGALFVVLAAVGLLLPGLGGGQRASFVVAGALLLAAPVLLSRPRVVADADGVTVVNIVSGRRLAWPEILQVNLRPGDPWVFLDLSDGTSLPALGIQPGFARRRAIDDTRALRALVDTHTRSDQERTT